MLPCMNRPAQRPSVAAGVLVSARVQDAGFGRSRAAGFTVMLHGTLNRTADRRPLSSVCDKRTVVSVRSDALERSSGGARPGHYQTRGSKENSTAPAARGTVLGLSANA